MGSPRTVDWLPAILRAGDVLHALALRDARCAEEFTSLRAARGRIPIVGGSNLEASHVLLDQVLAVSAVTMPEKRAATRLRTQGQGQGQGYWVFPQQGSGER